jgi:hypothetical protein
VSLIFQRGDLSIRDVTVTVRVGAEVNTAIENFEDCEAPHSRMGQTGEPRACNDMHVQLREVAARI